MMITVSLSVEEYRELEKLAQYRACINAETLLGCFAGDLLNSNWSGGSDERMFAHQWLDRRFDLECYAQQRPAALPKGGQQ